MAASLSSIFTIHPHSALRIKFNTHSFNHTHKLIQHFFIASPPKRSRFITPFALKFSSSSSFSKAPKFNDENIPSLHHFISQAQAQATPALTASDTVPHFE